MFYSMVKWGFSIVFKIFFPIQVTGVENIPKKGPVIVCSNHISWWDPPLMAVIIPRNSTFMAKEELFKNFIFGKIISALGAFPVRRGVPDRKAIKTALNNLQEGRVLTLFPEGTRSKTGELRKPLPGVGFIALKSQAPVVPVAIKGPYKLFKTTKVTIGRPLYAEDVKKDEKGKTIEQVSSSIMQSIAEML